MDTLLKLKFDWGAAGVWPGDRRGSHCDLQRGGLDCGEVWRATGPQADFLGFCLFKSTPPTFEVQACTLRLYLQERPNATKSGAADHKTSQLRKAQPLKR